MRHMLTPGGSYFKPCVSPPKEDLQKRSIKMRLLLTTLLSCLLWLTASTTYAAPPSIGSNGDFIDVIICKERDQLVAIVEAENPSLAYAGYRTQLDSANQPTCFVGTLINVKMRRIDPLGRMEKDGGFVLAWAVEVYRDDWSIWLLYLVNPPQT